MIKRGAYFLAIFVVLIALSTPASGAVQTQDVQSLLDRYGKEELIGAVLKIRDNRITVRVRNKLREFKGPPAPEFITIETLVSDLEKASVDAAHVEQTIKSLAQARRPQPQAPSNKPSSTEAHTSNKTPPTAPITSNKNSLFYIKTDHNTLYMLGSLHILKRDAYPLPAAIQNAYAESERIVFETDIGQMNEPATLQRMMKQGLYPNDITLAEKISDETYGLFQQEVTALGLPVAQFERFKPWLSALTIIALELKRLGFDPNYGIDQHFFNKAKQDGKECVFLETVDYQLGLFANMDDSQQESFLRQTLKDLKIVDTMAQQMIQAWQTGDIDQLGAILQMSFKDHPELYDRFVIDRNRAWIGRIEDLMKQGEDVLVVVGAGHLAGKESLIELLRAKGYEPVQS